MQKKLLCISCSQERVTLCQYIRHWRGLVLAKNVSMPVNASGYSDMAYQLVQLIAQHNLRSDEYRLSLSTHYAILRNWTFPFDSEQKILQVLSYELDSEIPLSREEALTAVQLGTKVDGKRKAVSATLKKEVLAELLPVLQENDIDPEVVTLDAFAVSDAVARLQAATPVLFLAMQEHSTLLLFMDDAQLTAVTLLPMGFAAVRRKLQRTLSVTAEDVDRQLFFTDLAGTVGQAENAEQFQQAFAACLDSWIRSILLSIDSVAEPFDSVILSGALSQIRGIEEAVAEGLGTPVVAIHKHQDVKNLPEVANHADWDASLPAFGLASGGAALLPRRASRLNLRRGEFAYIKQQDPLLQSVTYLTAIAVALLLVWSASMFAFGYHQEQAAATLKKGITQSVRTALPELKGNFGTIQYTSILQSRLSQLRGTDARNSIVAPVDQLDYYQALHRNAPAKLDVTVDLFTMNDSSIGLVGTAESYEALEQLRTQLAKNPLFSSVIVRGATNQKKQRRVRYELEIIKAG